MAGPAGQHVVTDAGDHGQEEATSIVCAQTRSQRTVRGGQLDVDADAEAEPAKRPERPVNRVGSCRRRGARGRAGAAPAGLERLLPEEGEVLARNRMPPTHASKKPVVTTSRLRSVPPKKRSHAPATVRMIRAAAVSRTASSAGRRPARSGC